MTIEQICEKYKITNYTINDDGSIDVNSEVWLNSKGLTELPLVFNKVSGYFDCGNNKLTSLKGCPRWVGGDFSCYNNKLTSLEFSPEHVVGNFSCNNNQLTSLEFSPEWVGGNFSCSNNYDLKNLKGVSEKIGGLFYCQRTPLSSIFSNVDQDFLYAFNFNRIIKNDTVNLKRLKYVMDLYDKPINLEKIKKYYKIV